MEGADPMRAPYQTLFPHTDVSPYIYIGSLFFTPESSYFLFRISQRIEYLAQPSIYVCIIQVYKTT